MAKKKKKRKAKKSMYGHPIIRMFLNGFVATILTIMIVKSMNWDWFLAIPIALLIVAGLRLSRNLIATSITTIALYMVIPGVVGVSPLATFLEVPTIDLVTAQTTLFASIMLAMVAVMSLNIGGLLKKFGL